MSDTSMTETAEACGGCASDSRAADTRAGRRLEQVTLGWNAAEAAIALWAGSAAGSIALLGFGIDSIVESASGLVLLWRLQPGPENESRERLAVRLVGLCFLALAAYVAYEAIESLVQREAPHTSVIGIGLAIASVILMPLLARAKRRVAKKLGSDALAADSRQNDLCAYLSAILLLGLVLHKALGWWWADPAAALLMAPIILREGVQCLRGKICCECH